MNALSIGKMKPEIFIVGLWKHECERVFMDKLANQADKKIDLSKHTVKWQLRLWIRSSWSISWRIIFCWLWAKIFNEDGELEE